MDYFDKISFKHIQPFRYKWYYRSTKRGWRF